MQSLILLIALFSSGAFATEPTVIIQMDPQYPVEKLASPGVEIRKIPANVSTDENVPTTKDSNRWLDQSNLSETVKDWDQFSKDELVIRAELVDTNKFLKMYPEIDPSALKKLQGIVKAARIPAAAQSKKASQ